MFNSKIRILSEKTTLIPISLGQYDLSYNPRPRLRALNGVLSVELQPEELLLEAMELSWRKESGEESSGEEMEVGSSMQPGGLATQSLCRKSRLDERKRKTNTAIML